MSYYINFYRIIFKPRYHNLITPYTSRFRSKIWYSFVPHRLDREVSVWEVTVILMCTVLKVETADQDAYRHQRSTKRKLSVFLPLSLSCSLFHASSSFLFFFSDGMFDYMWDNTGENIRRTKKLLEGRSRYKKDRARVENEWNEERERERRNLVGPPSFNGASMKEGPRASRRPP